MKVVHVIPAVAARYGGPSVATFGMCRALAVAGTSVLVATTDADGTGRLDVALEQVVSYQGSSVIFFRRRFADSFKWSGRLSHWLSAHVRDFDAVHVHAVFSHSSIAAGRACRIAGVPYIVRPLGTLDPWSVTRRRALKRVLFRLGVQELLSGATAMHYTSAEEQRLAETVVPDLPTGHVIPLGVEEDAFTSEVAARNDAGRPFVLALSRLDEKKGIDVLIRAFLKVREDAGLRQWRLVIAGDGDPGYVAHLRALASGRSDEATGVQFTGWVSGAAKLDLLRGASLFALPSHQENFGISLVEALASGVPALVSPGVNLARDIEAAGAGWVADRDDQAFAAGLQAALRDQRELARRGLLARTFASQFRWPSVATRLQSLYAEIADSTSGVPVRATLGRVPSVTAKDHV